MKKIMLTAFAAVIALSSQAIDIIYRGNSTDEKDIVCYFQGGRFYADKARKECLYHHPGNMVAKDQKATPQNCLYRLMSDKLYKGFSNKKEDCVATIFETKTFKGNTVGAKIYPGFVIVRDKKEKSIKGGTEIVSFNTTRDAVNVEKISALYTFADGKLYKGDSTDPADCVLTLKGSFNSARLLFIAIELTKLQK